MMKQETGYHDNSGHWIDGSHGYNTPHHQSPVHEFNGFAFNPMPMEPMYSAPMHPPRTTHQQLQPLIMPQWPSMITTQSSYATPVYPTAPVPIPPASTPVSATSTRSSSTPRKTLTDADRRRMCLYAEEHPTVKQTEIGGKRTFWSLTLCASANGCCEQPCSESSEGSLPPLHPKIPYLLTPSSTVSKVLRQKEKYLYQDDGSRSPIKRSKGKFPDIERALSNWARNHQKQGLPVTDSMIREKARFFATTVGSSESASKLTNGTWLEKFKQKNGLVGSKSRKNSIAEESEGGSNPPSMSQTPSGISPTSPNCVASSSPATVTSALGEEGLKVDTSEDVDYTGGHRPFHSQSNTSLSSVFSASSFSAGPTSPTSPFFTPDSAVGQSPFMPSQQTRMPPGSSNFHRPRSQTFPMLGIEPYMPGNGTSESLTPKYVGSTALDSLISEIPPHVVPEDTMQSPDSQRPTLLSRTPSTSMQPPPIPAAAANPTVTIPQLHGMHSQQQTPISPDANSPHSPSQEDARRALEVVINFFQHQPQGFVEPQDFLTIGKLMEKLKLQRNGEHLPGGLHRIPEQEYNVPKTEAA